MFAFVGVDNDQVASLQPVVVVGRVLKVDLGLLKLPPGNKRLNFKSPLVAKTWN